MLVRLMETQLWYQPPSAGGKLQQRKMASASTSIWEKDIPPVLAFKRQTTQFLLISPWCLSCCRPSSGAQNSDSVHESFRSNTWDSGNPLSHLPTTDAGFHSQNVWKLLFPALELWVGKPGVRLQPLDPQQGSLQLDPCFFTATDRCGTTPLHIFASPTSLNVASSLKP